MKKSNPFIEFDRLQEIKRQKLKDNESETDENEDDLSVPLANKTKYSYKPGKKLLLKEEDKFNDDDSMDEYSSGGEDDDDRDETEEEDDDELTQIKAIREKIKDMPMSKLRDLKDKLGLKLWGKVMQEDESTTSNSKNKFSDDESEDEEDSDEDDGPMEIKKKKRSNDAPREISYKKPVSELRNIDFGVNKKKRCIDPRFSNKSGEFIESEFVKDYGFLYDMQEKDLKNLTKEMKKVKKTNAARYNELKKMTNKMKNQLATARNKKIIVEAKEELKKKNIERMNVGLKPIFINNKNMKKMINDKHTEYRKSKGLQTKYEKQQRKKIRKGKKQQFKGKKNLLGIDDDEQ